MGNSLARERMLEKAEQVRGEISYLTSDSTKKDRLEKMNTKQRPGTPLVRFAALRRFLIVDRQRDPGLQHKVLYWIIDIMGEGPRGKTDFDHWIQEPTVLARVALHLGNTCSFH